MSTLLRAWTVTAASGLSLLCMAGCLSTHPGSSSLAYVDVEQHDTDAVRAETIRVFADAGYRLTGRTDGVLTFEREATQRDQVLHGRYGERLTMRVVVSIEPRRQGGSLLRADAYAVRDGNEEKLMRMTRWPYQTLLNQVKGSLVKAEGGE